LGATLRNQIRVPGCFGELVLPRQLDDPVILISQDDVALRVEFQDQVELVLILTEREDHHSLDANLLDTFESSRPKEFSELRWLNEKYTFIVKPEGILLLTKPYSSVKLNRTPFSMMRKSLCSDLLSLNT
jgi:GR25 family glycosyltransferase involved in LPS biosynthesis